MNNGYLNVKLVQVLESNISLQKLCGMFPSFVINDDEFKILPSFKRDAIFVSFVVDDLQNVVNPMNKNAYIRIYSSIESIVGTAHPIIVANESKWAPVTRFPYVDIEEREQLMKLIGIEGFDFESIDSICYAWRPLTDFQATRISGLIAKTSFTTSF